MGLTTERLVSVPTDVTLGNDVILGCEAPVTVTAEVADVAVAAFPLMSPEIVPEASRTTSVFASADVLGKIPPILTTVGISAVPAKSPASFRIPLVLVVASATAVEPGDSQVAAVPMEFTVNILLASLAVIVGSELLPPEGVDQLPLLSRYVPAAFVPPI